MVIVSRGKKEPYSQGTGQRLQVAHERVPLMQCLPEFKQRQGTPACFTEGPQFASSRSRLHQNREERPGGRMSNWLRYGSDSLLDYFSSVELTRIHARQAGENQGNMVPKKYRQVVITVMTRRVRLIPRLSLAVKKQDLQQIEERNLDEERDAPDNGCEVPFT
ncbi:hypothetical protein B0H17DRAFT_1150307 [Mycena rosella]|uniref:Uncharacterized protein n=1 Tax=Mycena rosella TaxID=1033263 RepID=A0AAD7FLM3_MYCRO|nr:hypothetical protein B0H17DRAFT_1150307 [Mycena rosella]